MANYPLPRDTAAALAGARVSNLGLYLDKFIEIDTSTWKATERAKKYEDAPTALWGEASGRALLAAIASRHRQLLTDADALVHTATPVNRLIVGLGTKGMLEVGIRLHHLYGYPIIPGSALKGLARAEAIIAIFYALKNKGVTIPPVKKGLNKETRKEEFWGTLQSLELHIEGYNRSAEVRPSWLDVLYGLPEEKEKPEQWREGMLVWQFQHIFGIKDRAGEAIFFDVVPDKVSFEVDIMNVHYPDYYNAKGKNTPPADYYSPTPIDFLTVGKASRFIFGVAVRHPRFTELRGAAWDWLKDGLENKGVGAKTTSGYGVFTNFHAET